MDKNIFKSASLKATKKRMMILDIIENESVPTTAEHIYEKLSELTDISLSTVYRALNAMTDKNILIKSINMDCKTYYQFNNNQHKHEIICSVCHKTVNIDDCPFEQIAKSISDKTGFVITGHNMAFTGICPDCLISNNKD